MKRKQKRFAMILLGVTVALTVLGAVRTHFFSNQDEATIVASAEPAAGPVPGKVTMIDLGATECIPCKMMAPIIEELKKEYANKANIVFIDVWKHPDQKKKYGIRAIPTQIFFDADGRELFRHTGFLEKARIIELLRRLGVS